MEKHEEDEEFDKLDHILEQSGCLKELEESKECQVKPKAFYLSLRL